MSGRAEDERRRSFIGRSPLRKHSMNQRDLSLTFQGVKRIEVPRKVRMAQRRKSSLNEETIHEEFTEQPEDIMDKALGSYTFSPTERFIKRYRS